MEEIEFPETATADFHKYIIERSREPQSSTNIFQLTAEIDARLQILNQYNQWLRKQHREISMEENKYLLELATLQNHIKTIHNKVSGIGEMIKNVAQLQHDLQTGIKKLNLFHLIEETGKCNGDENIQLLKKDFESLMEKFK